MDAYDPATVFSSIDSYGRYAYGNQPAMAQWNMARFAETIFGADRFRHAACGRCLRRRWSNSFREHFESLLDRRPCGARSGSSRSEEGDPALVSALLDLMQRNGCRLHAHLQAALRRGRARGAEEAFWARRHRSSSRNGSARGARASRATRSRRRIARARCARSIPRTYRAITASKRRIAAATEQAGLRAVRGDAASGVAALRGAAGPRGLSNAPAARGARAADVLRHLTGSNADADCSRAPVAAETAPPRPASSRACPPRRTCSSWAPGTRVCRPLARRRRRDSAPACWRRAPSARAVPGRNGGQVAYSLKPSFAKLTAPARRRCALLRSVAKDSRHSPICARWLLARSIATGATAAASSARTRRGTSSSWRTMRDNQPRRPRAAHHRRAEKRAAPRDRERVLSRRLRVPRRRIGRSHEAVARAFGSRPQRRRPGARRMRGAGHATHARRIRGARRPGA